MSLHTHEDFMKRAIELAKKGGGYVGSNPNVGAILVYENKVIGEGAYREFGGPHAEVNAVNDVSEENKKLISESTLYVTLEPCNFHGKTPPCSELILKNKIKNLVVGAIDPNPKIAGKSLAYLKDKGLKVVKGIMKKECQQLILPFRKNILENLPYITLKVAQSKDFYISKKGSQTWITNEYSKVLSHKLRAEHQAILIGTNTALIDNPSLTNRSYTGAHPLRIVIDKSNQIPTTHALISDDFPSLILNTKFRDETLAADKEQWIIDFEEGDWLEAFLSRLYNEKKVGRLLIEGGTYTINKFLKQGLWDQAYIITAPVKLGDGVKAANVAGRLEDSFLLHEDKVDVIKRLA